MTDCGDLEWTSPGMEIDRIFILNRERARVAASEMLPINTGCIFEMRTEVSSTNNQGFHKIELVEKPEGVYVFVYEHQNSSFPERDYLDDSWDIARERCLEDYGVPVDTWIELK